VPLARPVNARLLLAACCRPWEPRNLLAPPCRFNGLFGRAFPPCPGVPNCRQQGLGTILETGRVQNAAQSCSPSGSPMSYSIVMVPRVDRNRLSRCIGNHCCLNVIYFSLSRLRSALVSFFCARATHTRAICRNAVLSVSSSAVLANFTQSAAKRQNSSDVLIASSPNLNRNALL